MDIDKRRIEIWSQKGSSAGSRDAYHAIRAALRSKDGPLAGVPIKTYLHGSYRNGTNIRGSSDVDVVVVPAVEWDGSFHRLSAEQEAACRKFQPTPSIAHAEFKAAVASVLKERFSGVEVGAKAVHVPGTGGRRSADVLAARQYRRYHWYAGQNDQQFDDGVCFYAGGEWLDNYPRQHLRNCTTKNRSTKGRFKRAVRAFKNFRNHLVDRDRIAPDVAPSYFIECLLYSVPNRWFHKDPVRTLDNCLFWIRQKQRAQFWGIESASGMHELVRDERALCWPIEDFTRFANAVDLERNVF